MLRGNLLTIEEQSNTFSGILVLQSWHLTFPRKLWSLNGLYSETGKSNGGMYCSVKITKQTCGLEEDYFDILTSMEAIIISSYVDFPSK